MQDTGSARCLHRGCQHQRVALRRPARQFDRSIVHPAAGRGMRCRPAAQSFSTPDTVIKLRLRRATSMDAHAISLVYAETFGSENFPGLEDNTFIQAVQGRYSTAVERETAEKLTSALKNKAEAALAARAYRMSRAVALLKARLAVAQGKPAKFPTEGPAQLRQFAHWKRARSFVCLVVEEVEQQQQQQQRLASSTDGQAEDQPRKVVGTATISIMQAEAALPPPFPSNVAWRAYISNMAVLPAYRRQGLAKKLVTACARIAQAWGEPCVMLHVAATNTAAQQLYLSCGFQPVAHSQGLTGLIKGPWTQQRMVAEPSAVVAECQHNITASAAICNNSSRHGSFKCSASG